MRIFTTEAPRAQRGYAFFCPIGRSAVAKAPRDAARDKLAGHVPIGQNSSALRAVILNHDTEQGLSSKVETAYPFCGRQKLISSGGHPPASPERLAMAGRSPAHWKRALSLYPHAVAISPLARPSSAVACYGGWIGDCNSVVKSLLSL